jgi:F0F1-type ATP synthase assembly protein I
MKRTLSVNATSRGPSQEPVMSTARFPLILRRLLVIDATTCLAMGAALIFANAPLAGLTGLPPDLLMGAGLVLLPTAGFMLVLARRLSPSPAGVRVVIAGNLLWVLASVLLPLWPQIEPSGIGLLGLMAQAAGVAVLAALEQYALGWTSPAAARAA